jgi:uncharacterized protein YyaL (SSP411 family)
MRTRLLDEQGNPLYTNRLIKESSPYLRQHAHNPVDWFPWGEEAFVKARQEDKPVFLSIGYSTCHWCHVMEHESFDDEPIAAFLNQHFVAIKLDREVRPDIDDIYMTGVQLMTGQGGWPMSSFLTPEAKPFYSGTYFPPGPFKQILERIVAAWKGQRTELEDQARQVSDAIIKITAAAGKTEKLGQDLVSEAVQQHMSSFDDEEGGFNGAPKFPHEVNLLLLLDAWLRRSDPSVLKAISLTLDKMAQGGIYDQVGGGFHRYSVDAEWLVPHFEKMLYNQALLSRVYLKGYEITGNESWRRIAKQTFEYLIRDMQSAEGGFYSATDADSEGREGAFFVWTLTGLPDGLSADDRQLLVSYFQMSEQGNFEGSNILHAHTTLEVYAQEHNIDRAELLEQVERVRHTLYEARENRQQPLRDEKIIAAWNGMLISSLAQASRVLAQPEYFQVAERCAEFIWQMCWCPDSNSLQRIVIDGASSDAGNLEDYAYLGEGLLCLFDESGDKLWLSRALELAEAMIGRFHDSQDSGFFMAENQPGEPGIARPKSPMDGAIASGNSVAVHVLVRLFQCTGDLRYRTLVTDTMEAFAAQLNKMPSGFSYMLQGVENLIQGSTSEVQYAANGNVRIQLASDRSGEFKLMLTIAQGWHLNANEVQRPGLVSTSVRIADESGDLMLAKANYPSGQARQLAFESRPVELYSGQLEISGEITGFSQTVPTIILELQACNQELCLPAEQLKFYIPRLVS